MTRQYGVIGLGRMGGALVRNLHNAGGHAVVFDVNPANVQELAAEGATGAGSLADMAQKLLTPRIIWMMVPAGDAVDKVLAELQPHLSAGDVVIDGGNSFYRDSIRRSEELKAQGVHYLDSGTSGGLEGARNGLCCMVGGPAEAFALAEPLFQAIARAPGGYQHVGPSGAGHFVKMVHNGIEYAMMQAIGDGFELLQAGPYDLNLGQVADLWQKGSVVRSWLMELAARAFTSDPQLENITGEIGGGSTGNWAVEEAWKFGVPMTSIANAYMNRLRSRQHDTFSGKVQAALRREFGGHAVVEKK